MRGQDCRTAADSSWLCDGGKCELTDVNFAIDGWGAEKAPHFGCFERIMIFYAYIDRKC